MLLKHWRCSLGMISKWWLRANRTRNFTALIFPYGIARRNGTYKSILLSATTSSLAEKTPGKYDKTINLHDTAPFPRFLKSDFIPGLSPHRAYGMPACSPNLIVDINHLEGTQRLDTRLVNSICHLIYEERLQRMGLHSLQWRRLRADLITTFNILTGILDIDPNLLFLPPTHHGLRSQPYMELQGTSHRRREGQPFWWGLWSIGISS